MEGNLERQPGLVTFKNQPYLTKHEVDREANKLRVELVPQIESFLSNDELFSGKKVDVEFSHQGVASLVCFIEAEEGKFVLKIPLNPTSVEGEGEFLKAWEAAGVPVPHVFKEGKLAQSSYTL